MPSHQRGPAAVLRVLLFLPLLPMSLHAQEYRDETERPIVTRRIVSYNVENLFDTEDDPLTDDKEFLPSSPRHWTERIYHKKVQDISRTLSRIGEWGYPAIIGLVEVENVKVVRDLVDSSTLRKQDYRMSVSRGADPRGIDVALLWDPKLFRRVDAQEIPHYGETLTYPLRRDPRTKQQRSGKGRNTLWITLEQRHSGALLDVFVLHLPSRRGGVRATSEDRVRVCSKLRRVIEQLFLERPDAQVIIMGDFNDDPHNTALTQGLHAITTIPDPSRLEDHQLYNLAAALERKHEGSHYFSRHFWLPDQIIVSGSLLREGSQLRIKDQSMRVYAPRFLQDRQHHPRRTFMGLHYAGGYSDHFPVYADLIIDTTSDREAISHKEVIP